MGFNIMDLMNGATRAAVEGVDNYEAITLNLDEIKVTKHNRYSMDDLEELATSILMDGLQEPLIIGRVNGEYLLSGGHRRREALVILQNEGHTEITQNIPCRFKDMTETQFRLSLLIGNTFNRKMTDYDLMNQAADWKEVLTQARKEKLLVLEEGKRVRDYVAAVLGEKPTKIAQLEAINNNATEEVKEQFEKGNMKITSAYETSRLSEDAQKEVAAAVEAGADIKSEEIIPDDAVIETEDNRLGHIKGGAEIEYAPEFYEAKDDMGKVSKVIITEEEATLKSGIMTWCGTTLEKLCQTARVTEDKAKGIRTVKIGGIGNATGKKYLLRFVHKDTQDGNIRVTIVGNNQAGFTIAFAKDSETVIDAEFKAQPMDKEGTLILYTEDIDKTE